MCSRRPPFFPLGLLLGPTIISLSLFPALRIACPFPFSSVVLAACSVFWCYLANLHELSEGNRSLLCLWTSALSLLFFLLPFLCCSRNGACLHGIWLSAYTCPLVFCSLLLYILGLLLSAARHHVSIRGLCERNPVQSLLDRRLSLGNAKINLHLTFPDIRT